MKILNVLNPSLTDYKFAGAANLGINVGEGLKDLGCIVDYIASSAINELTDNRSIVYEYVEYRGNRIISDTIEYALDIYRKGNYDAIFINISQMSVLGAIDKYIPKEVPVLYTQHTPTILGRFSLNYRDSAKSLITDRDRKIKIISPCSNTVEILKQYIESEDTYNVEVIHNGIKPVDPDIAHPIYDKIGDYYCTCGRIVWDKGSCEIAEMCARAKKKLIVIGSFSIGSLKETQRDIDYYNQFAKIVEDNPDLITWIKDPISNDKVRRIMSFSRGFILASTVENCALAVSEALSVGVPIFFIEEPSTKEVTSEETGMYIPLQELYRKSWNNKMNICAKYLQEFDDKISTYDKNKIVQSYYDLDLDIESCSKHYYEAFETLIKD